MSLERAMAKLWSLDGDAYVYCYWNEKHKEGVFIVV